MKQDTRGMLQDEHGRGAASGKRDVELEAAKASAAKSAEALGVMRRDRRWWITTALVLLAVHARELLFAVARFMDAIGDRFDRHGRW